MTEIKRVLVVSKMTDLEHMEQQFGDALDDELVRKNMDKERLRRDYDIHYANLEMVLNSFERHGIKPGVRMKQSISSTDFETPWDLIVPMGGDGTFLDVCRYVKDSRLIMGIKSCAKSTGAHYNTTFENADAHIDALVQGNFSVEKRTRVAASVNGKAPGLALNEIYIGDIYRPGYSRLAIFVNGEERVVGGSGIVVATYRGKTGWFDSIPIVEKNTDVLQAYHKAHVAMGLEPRMVLNPAAEFTDVEEEIVRYKVSEQAQREKNYGYDFGILKLGDELTVRSHLRFDGYVAFDGSKPLQPRARCYELPFGATVTLRVSDKPLYVVKINA